MHKEVVKNYLNKNAGKLESETSSKSKFKIKPIDVFLHSVQISNAVTTKSMAITTFYLS